MSLAIGLTILLNVFTQKATLNVCLNLTNFLKVYSVSESNF
jgi:hypothetical protein